jgi:hypothetical protein
MARIFQELWDATQRGSFLSASSFLALFCLFPSSNDTVHGKERGRSRPSSHSGGFIAEDCLLPIDSRVITQRTVILFAASSRESRAKRHDTTHQFKGHTNRVLRPVTAETNRPSPTRESWTAEWQHTLCSFWYKLKDHSPETSQVQSSLSWILPSHSRYMHRQCLTRTRKLNPVHKSYHHTIRRCITQSAKERR